MQISGFYRDLDAKLTLSDRCLTQRFPVRTALCSDRSSKDGRLDYGLNFSNVSPFNPVQSPSVNPVNDELLTVPYDFSLNDGNTFTILETTGNNFNFTSRTRTSQADLDAFTGTGTAKVNFASFWYEINSTTCTGDDIIVLGQKVGQRDIETCEFTSSLDFSGRAEVFISYRYDPVVVDPPVDPPKDPSVVPVPAGLPLILTALGGLALLRRSSSGGPSA